MSTRLLKAAVRLLVGPGYVPVFGKAGLVDQFSSMGLKTHQSTHGACVVVWPSQVTAAHILTLFPALKKYIEDHLELCKISQVVDVIPKKVKWTGLRCELSE